MSRRTTHTGRPGLSLGYDRYLQGRDRTPLPAALVDPEHVAEQLLEHFGPAFARRTSVALLDLVHDLD